jgi:hypothetical protein
MNAVCYVTQADYDKHFGGDLEPRAHCRDCGAEIATAFDRCDDCEEQHQIRLDSATTNEPR